MLTTYLDTFSKKITVENSGSRLIVKAKTNSISVTSNDDKTSLMVVKLTD